MATFLTMYKLTIPEDVKPELRDRYVNIQLNRLAKGHCPDNCSKAPYPQAHKWATPAIIKVNDREYEVFYEGVDEDKAAPTLDLRSNSRNTVQTKIK